MLRLLLLDLDATMYAADRTVNGGCQRWCALPLPGLNSIRVPSETISINVVQQAQLEQAGTGNEGGDTADQHRYRDAAGGRARCQCRMMTNRVLQVPVNFVGTSNRIDEAWDCDGQTNGYKRLDGAESS